MANAAPTLGSVVITVDYGYGTHSIPLPKRTYDQIIAGKPLSLKGPGFNWDGGLDQDMWHFNREQPGSLLVFAENGGEIYSGSFDEEDVRVEPLVPQK